MSNKVIPVFFILFLLNAPIWAKPLEYWQCHAEDDSRHQWFSHSSFARVALNHALQNCKRTSTSPHTCQANRENCEQFISGINTKPLWRCTAFDRAATRWRSNNYAHRDDAAFAARATCREKSTIPETCYVNFITCINRIGMDI